MTHASLENNPYFRGEYAPVSQETTLDLLPVQGEIPRELSGCFVRNSPNARFTPRGTYHWFDGDGMLYQMQFSEGKASFKNRYVRTEAFELEDKEGRALWNGILDPLDLQSPYGPLKNTSNTDVVWHHGRLLSLWWLGDRPYEIQVPSLKTLRPYHMGGKLNAGMASHPKVDPKTGEMMFIDFPFIPKAPFLRYGIVSADAQEVSVIPIEIPGQRLFHDIAITENYTLFLDLPMYNDPAAMMKGKQKIIFNRDLPSRFGIIPRHGKSHEIRWFESSPCYIYHTINAYEQGEEIILTACRIENPLMDQDQMIQGIPHLYYLRFQPRLHRWKLNLKTGQCTDERLDDTYTEFPRMNDQMLGRKTRYSYNPRVAQQPTVLFDAIVKADSEQGKHVTYEYPRDCFGGEVVFVPRILPHSAPQSSGRSGVIPDVECDVTLDAQYDVTLDAQYGVTLDAQYEDSGWIMTFLYNRRDNTSEFIILDAQDIAAGPIATIPIPVRVPIGFHACWVPGSEISQ